MHHIDVHVTNVDRTRKLLDAFMPLVGYQLRNEYDDFVSYWRNGTRPSIGFIEDGARNAAGMIRIAFAVPTTEAVDTAANAALGAGARNVEGPSIHPEYGDDYYAVFFEDDDGNKFEIVHDAMGAPA